jgi:hypothetical protein
MQSGAVVAIADTDNKDNQQAPVDGENRRARWPTYMRNVVRSTGLIWKESGYKMACGSNEFFNT